MSLDSRRRFLLLLAIAFLLLFVARTRGGTLVLLLAAALFELAASSCRAVKALLVTKPQTMGTLGCLILLSLVVLVDVILLKGEESAGGGGASLPLGPFASRGTKGTLPPPLSTPREGTRQVSIVIPARNEDLYIARTVEFILLETPLHLLKEILIVDDGSETAVEKVLLRDVRAPEGWQEYVRVVRSKTKQGLIRARILGADLAEGELVLFMDGHCRVTRGYLEPLLEQVKENYRRVAVPVVPAMNGTNWELLDTEGAKMMFDWNFQFNWYDDGGDEVPIASGGILLIDKRWWVESGKYDPWQLEWGGENIEMSIRVWLCGGEIVVVRSSKIGHIFNRPNQDKKVTIKDAPERNNARAARVWLDDYYKYFSQATPQTVHMELGPGLVERIALRQQMKCRGFEWFVSRFRSAFERRGLLAGSFHHLRHVRSRWCLSSKSVSDQQIAEGTHPPVFLAPCSRTDETQRWTVVNGGRMLLNMKIGKCLDRLWAPFGSHSRETPALFQCDWEGVAEGKNGNQLWQFDNRERPGEMGDLKGEGESSVEEGEALSRRIFTFPVEDGDGSIGEQRPPLAPKPPARMRRRQPEGIADSDSAASVRKGGADADVIQHEKATLPSSMCLTNDLVFDSADDSRPEGLGAQDRRYADRWKHSKDTVYMAPCGAPVPLHRWTDPQEFEFIW
uniref:Glycosyltransferase 2-like domain-containing protein n=1 Tax=Chromera velia CCMP2878 TaxID=1169474 RepID=A0A0G4F6Y3_9ALVE|eukprot:Cvel_15438.t1-p1 / transcript=Cvel_15438.t1 / gene=Cvel_15438 / organism=Chromera_velia_CCMP2878 / gene_product=Polypeptide N-acetylgalactosaminyltransferase 14, putative / transcript_product=Polypeptide N-acetylgalactosaminyltransferase 14, putative / location=Cvel_scaffold1142:2867-8323(+) / protein_length=677 / sequence_SO=supercontig / SO=protein_coding / is_pseudo=false